MKKIGKYQIEHRLGRGGMAEVWLGNHPTLNRQVAIKVLHPFLGEEAGFDQRFVQEARLVASLRHPNIVQLYDFDIDDGRPFMVMEYLQGGTLYDWLNLRPEPVLPLTEVVRLFGQIAKGLSYAHQQGAIHRDLKPANILLTESGEPVISDFGIAKLLHRDNNLSVTGSAIGTPNYMSPEQATGGKIDGRSDIYALGVMLFELMTSELPFSADSAAGLLSQHISQAPPSPRRLNPKLSIEVEQVILRALAKEPDDRFADGSEMADALFKALGQAALIDDGDGRETGMETFDMLAATDQYRPPTRSATLGSMIEPPQISSLPDLSSMGLTVATVLAVADRPLSHLLLADILGEKDEAVLAALDELWQFELIEADEKRGDYQISDAQLKQKICERASPAKRTLLHRKCAEVFSHQNFAHERIPVWEIGCHYKLAGQLVQAVQFFVLDIEYQIGIESSEIRSRIKELMMLLEHHEDIRAERSKIYWLRALILAKFEGWESQDVTIALNQAEAKLEQPTDSNHLLKLLMARWLNAFFIKQLQVSKQIAQEFVQTAQAEHQLHMRPMGHLMLGLSLLELKRQAPAKANFLRGLDLYVPDGSNEFKPYAFLNTGLLLRMALSYTCRQMGETNESVYYVNQSISYSQQVVQDNQ